MFLHIGNNIVIDTREIIGIFDINSLKKGKEFYKMHQELKKNKQVMDFSDGNEKSYILLKKGEKIMTYISNISSLTLSKRIKEKKLDFCNRINI